MNTFGENVMRVPVEASRTAAASRRRSSSGALSRSSGRNLSPRARADGGGLDGRVAVPADEGLVEGRAAPLVHEHGRDVAASEVLVAPAHQRDEGGGQVDALRREPVLVAGGPVLVLA